MKNKVTIKITTDNSEFTKIYNVESHLNEVNTMREFEKKIKEISK